MTATQTSVDNGYSVAIIQPVQGFAPTDPADMPEQGQVIRTELRDVHRAEADGYCWGHNTRAMNDGTPNRWAVPVLPGHTAKRGDTLCQTPLFSQG